MSIGLSNTMNEELGIIGVSGIMAVKVTVERPSGAQMAMASFCCVMCDSTNR